MSYVVVDVESDGPIPNKYSMVCFGAVVLESSLTKTFYGKVKPISLEWEAEALAVSGFTRAEHEAFDGNPFGFSGRRIGDLYCGMKMDTRLNQEWKKKYRKTSHDHNPVNDAIGNAEAL